MWFCATHLGLWLLTISAPERRKVSLSQAPRWVPAPLSSLINSRWQGSRLSLGEWHVWRKNCWGPWKPVGWLWWLRHHTRSHPPPSDCGRWRREQRDLCSPCHPCPPCCLPESHRTPGGMTCERVCHHSPICPLWHPFLNWVTWSRYSAWWITWACFLSRPQPRHSFLRGTFPDAPWPSWSLPAVGFPGPVPLSLRHCSDLKFPFTGMDFRKLKLFFSTKLLAP